MSSEVVAKAKEIVTVLDNSYKDTRDVEADLGGYVLIARTAEDLKAIKDIINLEYHVPEYVDLIKCTNGEFYTCSLMILSSDYSISLIMPLRLTPKELLDYLEK